MQNFDGDYIDRLNRTYRGGKFIKAVVVTESLSPLVKKYWADHETPIQFAGQSYEPLHMLWEGIKTSQSMLTAGASVAVSNLGNHAIQYIKEIDITGAPILL